jgi:predicted dehydrogenase
MNKLLIIGAGMYVTGANSDSIGTILGTSIEHLSLVQSTAQICVLSMSERSFDNVQNCQSFFNNKFNSDIFVEHRSLESFSGSYEEKLNKAIDAVKPDIAIVSTPDHTHFEILTILLGRGIHTLCVKPLVETTSQHLELIKIAESTNTYCAIEFHKRLDESNLYSKKLVDSGDLGTIYSSYVQYSQRLSIPAVTFKSWSHKTNIFQYLGVHYVDLLIWLTNGKPQRCYSRGFRGRLNAQGIDTFDSVHVILELLLPDLSTALCHFDISWIDSDLSPCMSNQKYSLYGSKGRIDIDQGNRGINLLKSSQQLQHINPWFCELLTSSDGKVSLSGYGPRSITQFLRDSENILMDPNYIHSLIDCRPSIQSCIPVTMVLECVNKQLSTNTYNWISI